jgi:hypothetical protein
VTGELSPRSTWAQRITAACSIILVMGFVFSWFFAYVIVQSFSQAFSSLGNDESFGAATRQWVCLSYTDWVLKRYDEGMTTAQITASIDQAVTWTDTSTPGQPIQRVSQERRIDAPQVCGPVAKVLSATNRDPR